MILMKICVVAAATERRNDASVIARAGDISAARDAVRAWHLSLRAHIRCGVRISFLPVPAAWPPRVATPGPPLSLPRDSPGACSALARTERRGEVREGAPWVPGAERRVNVSYCPSI